MNNDIKLANFILCENVQNVPTPDGVQTNYINAFSDIQIPFVPTLYSFYIVASIECNALPDGSSIAIIVNDPKEKRVFSTGDVEIPHGAFLSQEGQMQCNFNMDFRNFLIQTEGEYTIDIFVNKNKIGRKTFRVVEPSRS